MNDSTMLVVGHVKPSRAFAIPGLETLGFCVHPDEPGICDCPGCRCPACGGAAVWDDIFCSERCQDVSRSVWLLCAAVEELL